MGNQTCAPDKGTEEQPPMDTEEVKENAQQDTKLINLLNSYQAENEKLKEQVNQLKDQPAPEPAVDKEKEQQLLSEVEQLKAQLAAKEEALKLKQSEIENEEKRIATLKLQNAIIRQEAKVYRNAKNTQVLIEGNLTKFTKGGKGKTSQKHVQITHREGDVNGDAFTGGQLTLCYADKETDSKLTRAVIVGVRDGQGEVKSKEYEGRVFSVVTEPNDKVIAFACKSAEDRNKWFKTLSEALDHDEKMDDEMNKEFEIELEFKNRPLGFRVEEQFIPRPDGGEDDVLVVAMIQDEYEHLRDQGLAEGLIITKCNDTDFTPLSYTQKLNIIKKVNFPIKLTFKGRGYMKRTDSMKSLPVVGHTRDVSMQALYQTDLDKLSTELLAQLESGGEQALTKEALLKHPLVKKNPELKTWLDRPDFKELIEELISDPMKFKEFLQDKTL